MLTYTLGELSVETYQAGNVFLTQGFHQPSFLITNITNKKLVLAEVSVYPNPATEFIKIRCEFLGYNFRLVDMAGKTISEGKLDKFETEIKLNDISEGVFFIEIFSVMAPYRNTYKVVKQ